jgi:taurine dioxygenase
LQGLIGVNSSAKAGASKTREERVRDGAKSDAKKEYIGKHPETGRKALYINSAHMRRFEGMTEQESAPMLAFSPGDAPRDAGVR